MKKKRTIQLMLLLLTLELPLMLMRVERTGSAPVHTYYAANLRYPLVIAHQGGNGLWPGNTMYAFQQAVDLGVDVIETDIRLSKDGTLVLMHDKRVDHTTNGSGLIEDMTLSELEALDAGFKWSLMEARALPSATRVSQCPRWSRFFGHSREPALCSKSSRPGRRSSSRYVI